MYVSCQDHNKIFRLDIRELLYDRHFKTNFDEINYPNNQIIFITLSMLARPKEVNNRHNMSLHTVAD